MPTVNLGIPPDQLSFSDVKFKKFYSKLQPKKKALYLVAFGKVFAVESKNYCEIHALIYSELEHAVRGYPGQPAFWSDLKQQVYKRAVDDIFRIACQAGEDVAD